MLDLHSFVWPARKDCNVRSWFLSVWMRMEENIILKKKLTELSLCVSASKVLLQSEFEATFTDIVYNWGWIKQQNCSFTWTPLWLQSPVLGHCHLEYFFQDVDVFDRVSNYVGVSAHPDKILSQDFCDTFTVFVTILVGDQSRLKLQQMYGKLFNFQTLYLHYYTTEFDKNHVF